MLGTSLCLSDASVWLPMPTVTFMMCFAPPAPRYAPAPSSQLIPAVSALFDVFKASVNPLDSSAWPLDASTQFPGPFTSPACQLGLPRCTRSIPPPFGLSNTINSIMSASDSFGVSAGSTPQPASPSTVSQSVDLGQNNNPNTTPTKDYKNVRVVVYLCGVQRGCAEEGERGSTPTG